MKGGARCGPSRAPGALGNKVMPLPYDKSLQATEADYAATSMFSGCTQPIQLLDFTRTSSPEEAVYRRGGVSAPRPAFTRTTARLGLTQHGEPTSQSRDEKSEPRPPSPLPMSRGAIESCSKVRAVGRGGPGGKNRGRPHQLRRAVSEIERHGRKRPNFETGWPVLPA